MLRSAASLRRAHFRLPTHLSMVGQLVLRTCIAIGVVGVAVHGASNVTGEVLPMPGSVAFAAPPPIDLSYLNVIDWQLSEAFIRMLERRVRMLTWFIALTLVSPLIAPSCVDRDLLYRIVVTVTLLTLVCAIGYVPVVVAPKFRMIAQANAHALHLVRLAERTYQLKEASPGSLPHDTVVKHFLRYRALSGFAGSPNRALASLGSWAARLACQAERHLLGVLPNATLSDDDHPCPICLGTMAGTMVRRLACDDGHVFHMTCIDRRPTTCPECKRRSVLLKLNSL